MPVPVNSKSRKGEVEVALMEQQAAKMALSPQLPPLEVSGNRSDVSSTIIFQLAKM